MGVKQIPKIMGAMNVCAVGWDNSVPLQLPFCTIAEIEAPSMRKVLSWYENVAGVGYFIDGAFKGKDIANTALPQLFGINTKDDIYNFYK